MGMSRAMGGLGTYLADPSFFGLYTGLIAVVVLWGQRRAVEWGYIPGFPFSLLCLSFFVVLVLVLIVVLAIVLCGWVSDEQRGWGPHTWFPRCPCYLSL